MLCFPFAFQSQTEGAGKPLIFRSETIVRNCGSQPPSSFFFRKQNLTHSYIAAAVASSHQPPRALAPQRQYSLLCLGIESRAWVHHLSPVTLSASGHSTSPRKDHFSYQKVSWCCMCSRLTGKGLLNTMQQWISSTHLQKQKISSSLPAAKNKTNKKKKLRLTAVVSSVKNVFCRFVQSQCYFHVKY